MHASSPDEDFAALAPFERTVLRAAVRPAAIVMGAVALIAGAGWALVLAHWSTLGRSAAGSGIFLPGAGTELPQWVSSLCGALIGTGAPTTPAHWLFLAAFIMWAAMVLAMMLPAAGPMLTTYAQIAETAIARGRRLVSVVTLAGGYLTAWLIFCLGAASLQVLLLRSQLASAAQVEAVPWLAGMLLLAAGLYQFAPLKQACLSKCRTPFGFFMANWRENASGVFFLGLRQGAFCIGCCWALMAAMFAAGAMNPFWMLALAVVMIAERLAPRGDMVAQASGAVLAGAGILVLGMALAG